MPARSLKKFIVLVQAIALIFAPLSTSAVGGNPADSDTRKEQHFLISEPIQTSAGSTHVEVQTFEIRNESDLAEFRAEIGEKIKETPQSSEAFSFEFQTPEALTTEEARVREAGRRTLSEIESLIETGKITRSTPYSVAGPNKGDFFKRHYNLTLSFVRLVANTTVVTTGLIMGSGLSPEHALFVGALAGAMSGAVQLKSDALTRWLTNAVLLSNTAKKMGLLKPSPDGKASSVEKVLNGAEGVTRWTSLEAAFLVVLNVAIGNFNLMEYILTLGKSVISQGFHEGGTIAATQALEKLSPRWAERSAVIRNISFFAGSGVSVLAAVGSMVGMPFADLGFLALTASGAILMLAPKVARTKTVQSLLSHWKRAERPSGRAAAGSCRALFAL